MTRTQKYPVIAMYGVAGGRFNRHSFDLMDDYEAFKLIRHYRSGDWYVMTNDPEMEARFPTQSDLREAWNEEDYDSGMYWMWTGFLTYGELAEITGFIIPNRMP